MDTAGVALALYGERITANSYSYFVVIGRAEGGTGGME